MSLSFSIRMWKGYCTFYSSFRYPWCPFRVLLKWRFSSWSRSTVCDVGGKNCVWQSTDQERRESKTASAKWNCANGSALRVGRYPGDKSLGTPGAISGKTSPRSRTDPSNLRSFMEDTISKRYYINSCFLCSRLSVKCPLAFPSGEETASSWFCFVIPQDFVNLTTTKLAKLNLPRDSRTTYNLSIKGRVNRTHKA